SGPRRHGHRLRSRAGIARPARGLEGASLCQHHARHTAFPGHPDFVRHLREATQRRYRPDRTDPAMEVKTAARSRFFLDRRTRPWYEQTTVPSEGSNTCARRAHGVGLARSPLTKRLFPAHAGGVTPNVRIETTEEI